MPFFFFFLVGIYYTHGDEIYLCHGFQSNLKENVSAIRLVWVYFFFNSEEMTPSMKFQAFYRSCGRISVEIICLWQGLDTCCSRLLPGAWWHCQSHKWPKGGSGTGQTEHRKMSVCTAPEFVAVSMALSVMEAGFRQLLVFPFFKLDELVEGALVNQGASLARLVWVQTRCRCMDEAVFLWVVSIVFWRSWFSPRWKTRVLPPLLER